MPAPSSLHIATQSVQRLLKEEASYRKELAQQDARVKKLEEEIKATGSSEDGNAEFMLKQEKKARAETQAIFGPLRKRIDEAVQKLEVQVEDGKNAPAEELTKGKEVLAQAKAPAEADAETDKAK